MQVWMDANEELGMNIPLFINHDSARRWFKEQVGNRFVMVDSKIESGVKFYVYHLVHDKLVYAKTANAIREGSPFLQSDFHNSYSEIEISEEGFIFVKHRGNDNEQSNERNVDGLYPKSNA